MKLIKKLKPVLHFRVGDYAYRFILVDRFKHTSSTHYGFDGDAEMTEDEIWQAFNPRKLRRKYIIKKE